MFISKTVRSLSIALSIGLSFAVTTVATAATVDYGGYMRAPVGSNVAGGKQILITNSGSQGNEFRLGNEAGYGEAGLGVHLLSPTQDQPFFDTLTAFAYNPPMNSVYGDTSRTTDYIQFIQAYVRAGNIDGSKLVYWAGKRFYRDAYVAMDDFFYFANMNGNGAGVENITLGSGTLSVAYLQYADDQITSSKIGLPEKRALDLQWHHVRLSNDDELNVWLAGASAAPGSGTLSGTGAVSFQATVGSAAGIRWHHKFSLGLNDVALMYGTGNMENFQLDNSAYTASTTDLNQKRRARVVEDFRANLGQWLVETALIAESASSGAATGSKSKWWSIGIRPSYNFTEHLRLITEAGYSVASDESEGVTLGRDVGDRTLTRVTVAPELGLPYSAFPWAALRTYVTYSSWNSANADAANTSSIVGKLLSTKVADLSGQTQMLQYGFQAEVVF